MHDRFFREPSQPGREDFGRSLYDSGIGYVDEILAGIDRNLGVRREYDHGRRIGPWRGIR